jgi:serine/threonine protein kinase
LLGRRQIVGFLVTTFHSIWQLNTRQKLNSPTSGHDAFPLWRHGTYEHNVIASLMASHAPFARPPGWNHCPDIIPTAKSTLLPQPQLSTIMTTRADFQTIKALSAGKAGGQNEGIFLVKSRRSGALYIEKHVKTQDLRRGIAQRETRAMIQCANQPNIVQICAHVFHDAYRIGYGSIFMQHCELGCLSGLITRYAAQKDLLTDEGFLWKVLWDAAIAFCHLYTGRSAYTIRKCAQDQTRVETKAGWNRIIHRDVKPANFFITTKNSGDHSHYPTIVLGDFGFCTSFAGINAGVANGHRNSGLTPSFKVPEDPQFCARSDV